jgi:pimeloyl-ACP methyl ester carboxylesterase
MTHPTVALVHGAFVDSSSWDPVNRVLQSIGYTTIAVANPLRGLTHDANYVRSVLASLPGEVVLVGHCYGGAVIGNAARGLDNVKALVFIAAFMLAEGECCGSALEFGARPSRWPHPGSTLVRPCSNAASAGGLDLDIYIQPDKFHGLLAQDVHGDTANVMAARQRPLSVTANTDVSGHPAWRDIPSWALVAEQDQLIDPGNQHRMAHRAEAHVETVKSSHAVPLSQFHAVVDSIVAADRGTHARRLIGAAARTAVT